MGMYPYSFLSVHRDWLRCVESIVSSMLPHEIGVVSDEPAVLHSTGQSEAQMHPDVVVQGAVVGRGVRAEWAIPMRDFTLDDPAFVDMGATLLDLSHGGRADNVIQPVASVVRVAGVNNLALDTTEDINNITALKSVWLWSSPAGFPSFPFPAGRYSPPQWLLGLCSS